MIDEAPSTSTHNDMLTYLFASTSNAGGREAFGEGRTIIILRFNGDVARRVKIPQLSVPDETCEPFSEWVGTIVNHVRPYETCARRVNVDPSTIVDDGADSGAQEIKCHRVLRRYDDTVAVAESPESILFKGLRLSRYQ